jgi:hypothetical protein
VNEYVVYGLLFFNTFGVVSINRWVRRTHEKSERVIKILQMQNKRKNPEAEAKEFSTFLKAVMGDEDVRRIL